MDILVIVPKDFLGYVERRVNAILELYSIDSWNYVETASNPADVGTRPKTPLELVDSLWFRGPSIITETICVNRSFDQVDLPEEVTVKIVCQSKIENEGDVFDSLVQRNSCFKILGVTSKFLSIRGAVDFAQQKFGI